MHRVNTHLGALMLLASLAVAPATAAVELSDDGMGEVLIFPFFIADNGWDTYINVQATSRRTATESNRWQALSLRVVLREGRNGEIIDTFNTYSTHPNGQSAWRSALYRNSKGQTRLRVAEGQCLVDSAGTAHSGAGVELPVDTSVGLIEVYSMGEPSRLAESSAAPLVCEELAANWDSPNGRWTTDPAEGQELWPSDISGTGALINVQQGLSGVYEATALRGFNGDAVLVHTHPASLSPNLADAQAGVINGVLQPDGITTVAQLLTTSALSNDVVALSEVAASTDWIISYPTSGYHAARPFDVEIDGEPRNCSSFGDYGPDPEPGDPLATMSIVEAKNVFFSTSGDGTWRGSYGDPQLDPTPSTQAGVALCNAVNVLTFDGQPSMLVPGDSEYLENLDGLVGASSHLWWAPVGQDSSGGEPVLALRLTRFMNGTLEGGSVLSNYLFMEPHRRGVEVRELREE